MDRWLKPKWKATEDIIDGPSCSKQSDLSQKKTKCRKYDVEYLSMGFTCSGSEHEQQPQCVLCYEILSNEAMKPSKLRRHLETKHREHATKCTEFLKNKEQELRQSRKIIKKTAIGSFKENALKASYEVSMLIAKAGKPHTIAEELIVPAAKAMVSAMVGEKAAKDLDLVPLSNNTVKRRIDKMSDNIKEQLIERICKSQYYSLQVESTDIANKSHLLCYVRYEFERNIIEDLLFCRYLIHTTAEEVFSTFNEFLTSNGIQWSKCIGISTDGTRAMSGRLTGLVARIREINSSVVWHHCCIHRESLATKKMPEELKKVLNESVEIENVIKARSLN
ncbi:hypothetical protein NDU88_004073 [Pleurodeles waltl]|uniref:Uncharacterized protein n=1 Tax=Pleurodeles waltl TaxID=8319 RepID=A0AAV7QHE0_PLEWA|nr:hypothetical protein NDU88_004073 [Pleurodeles waltl]